MPPIAIAFVLMAAILYTFAVLLLKRATDWRPGPWRVTFICNVATTALFAPLWFFTDKPIDWTLLWQPTIAALLFVGGQVLVIVALTLGDVSIATPLLGLKILIVTLISLTLVGFGAESAGATGETVKLIGAAVLATLAVALLGTSGSTGGHRRVLLTAVASIGAATCYAVFDCCLQVWGPTWGTFRLMPAVMLIAGVMSMGLIPFFKGPLSQIDRKAMPWIGGGAFLMALQAIFLTCTISGYGYAAEANVIYSSRGLWTVILVWLAGQWFSRDEQAAGRRTMPKRLFAATLLSLAILLVV